MQPEIQEASWSFCNDMNSTFDQLSYGFNMDAHVGDYGFSSLFSPPEDTSDVSTMPFPSMDHFQYLLDEDSLQLPSAVDDFPMDWDAFDPNSYAETLGVFGYSEESDGSFSIAQIMGNLGYTEESEGSFPSVSFTSDGLDAGGSPSPSMQSEMSAVSPSLSLPQEDMEIDNQLSLPHLLEAHGEAIELGQKTLAEVILRCLSHKVIPLGVALERLAFYLPQDTTTQGHFIKQEAGKNLELAFKACYQGLPNGKVSHLTANSAIVQAIPEDSEVIHIVDYDIGSGIQWPQIIEAIAQRRKTLILTSIKLEVDKSECLSSPWKFEETKRNLFEHAKSFGLTLNFKVEEKTIEDLVTDLKKMNKRGGTRREWIAFNCHLGLPHMGRARSRTHVMKFLKVAKDFIKNNANRGIVILGDGDANEKAKNCINFKSFFDGHLAHYRALLESIESNFPKHLSAARLAIECLFVAPYISSLAWFQKWEETQESGLLQTEIGLEGHRLNKGTLMEIREMLRGYAGPYEAKIEGQNENEIALEWRGTQLLRVSIWGN